MYFLIYPPVGNKHNPGVVEQDKLSTYTGLDDNDTLFKDRHGRGVIDSVPISDERVPTTPLVAMSTMTSSMGVTENLMIGQYQNMPLRVNI